MKKVLFLAGGQPFRSTDFEVIQTGVLNSIKQVLAEATTDTVILSGLEYVAPPGITDPGVPFTVPAGYIWDREEVCAVAEFTYNYDATKTLYLRRSEVLSNQRSIAGVNQFVMQERIYSLVYLTAPLAGDITFVGRKRLRLVSEVNSKLSVDTHAVDLKPGYAATTGDGLYCFRNGINERMINCSFTASAANGTLCTLPPDMRPSYDLFGYFRAGNTIQPIIIRANGDIEVTGAVTSGTNVIMFRYPIGIDFTI